VIARFTASNSQTVVPGSTVNLDVTEVNVPGSGVIMVSDDLILGRGTYQLRGTVGQTTDAAPDGWVSFGFFDVTGPLQWIGGGGLVGDPGSSRFERAPTEASAVIVVTSLDTPTVVNLRISEVDDGGSSTISGGAGGFDFWGDAGLSRAWVTVERIG
jgi:hypothetical protein